ncbi:MAG TPA: Ig-like domain-containing protein [Actinomycetota bacterium]|nr:Ig-like domain-containing protein [Actinomycetota bacterium]
MVKRAGHRSRSRALAFVALVALGAALQSMPAFAVPSAPTVHIEDGGDGFLNAGEVTNVTVTGTFAAAVPPVDKIEVRILGSAVCDPNSPNFTPLKTATLNSPLPGQWTAGPFNVSGFPEGTKLCARARASDNGGTTYGAFGLSANRPIKDTVITKGVSRLVDPNADGYMNANEAATSLIAGSWTAHDSDSVASQHWFEDALGTIPAGCGPIPATISDAPSGTLALDVACASALPEGDSFFFTTIWKDAAGNISLEATSASLVKDTVLPVAPSITIESDPIKLANHDQVKVSGAAEIDSTVDVTVQEQAAPTTILRKRTVATAGAWSLTFDGRDLADGMVDAFATSTDAAGNVSTPVSTDDAFKDATPPGAPQVDIIPHNIYQLGQAQSVEIVVDGDSNTTAKLSIDDTDPLTTPVTKTFPVNSEVTVYADIATLTDGVITATVILLDSVGNPSAPGTDTASKDLDGAPFVAVVSPSNGSIYKSGTNVTFTGTATPHSTVTLYEDTEPLAAASAGPAGSWSLQTGVLSDGYHTITVVARDASGRPSETVTRVLEIDPKIPTITAPSNGALVPGIFQVSGIGKPATTIEVYREEDGDERQVGRATVLSNGTWSTEVGANSGVVVLKARGIDQFGRTSIFGAKVTVNVDSVRPRVRYITPAAYVFLPDDDVRLDGSATDNVAIDHVEVDIINTLRGGKIVSGNAVCVTGCGTAAMEWFFKPASLAPGMYTVQTYAVDTAGNRSLAASLLIVRL